jgi:hypothetical protein
MMAVGGGAKMACRKISKQLREFRSTFFGIAHFPAL